MVETKKKTIGGLEFTTTQFVASRAFELLARLIRMLGPALGELLNLDPTADIDMAAVGALAPALANLDPKEASALMRDVLQCTSVVIPDATGGRMLEFAKPENIDLVFTGKLKMMFAAVGFALQVNFGDFSEGSDPAAPEAKQAAQS